MKTSIFSLLLSISYLFANGGPVDGTGIFQTGDLRFAHKHDIQCVAENLELDLYPNHVDVRVVYTLHNRSSKADTVQYGFPVDMVETEFNYGNDFAWNDENLENLTFWSGAAPLPIINVKLESMLSMVLDLPDMLGESYGEQRVLRKWFFTQFVIPQNSSINLEVNYRLKVFYEDWATSKSYLPSFGRRFFTWDFSPAQYWGNGVSTNLELKINTENIGGGNINVKGLDLEKNKKVLSRKIENFDFKGSSPLVITYDPPNDQLMSRYVWDDRVDRSAILAARASSSLPGNYGPELAIDGDFKTAWVEGVKGDGVGEWIEFDLDENAYRFHIVMVVGGYTKSRETYIKNRGVRTLLVERFYQDKQLSNDTIRLKFQRFEPIDEKNFYSMTYFNDMGDAGWKLTRIRCTILETIPGTHYDDTCISEILLLGWKLRD